MRIILNDQQKKVVEDPRNVLLTACPGSGKTRVLIHKVADNLQIIQGTNKRVIALTFTNRAAEEITDRVTKMDLDLTNLWTGTIHSFCIEWILRPYAGYSEELKGGFVIADEYKSEEILDSLKKKRTTPIYDLSTRLDENGDFMDLQNVKILTEYHELLRREKLIDFEQILYHALSLLAKHPKICKTLNNLFHLICIDEYQDTQQLQYAIIGKILNVPHRKTSVFLVGDRDQAIYGSLGGVAKSIDEIKTQFGGFEIAELELGGNYRSTQRLIDYYRHFQTTAIKIKSLCDYARDPGMIVFENKTVNKDSLDETIAALVKKALDDGIPEKEICVLSPQWWMVIPMGRKLKALLPNVSFDALGLSPLLRNRENVWFKIARLILVEPSPNMYRTRNNWANELVNELENSGLQIFIESERKGKVFLRMINSLRSEKENGLEYLKDCFEQLLEKLEISLSSNPTLKLHWISFFEGAKKRLDNADFGYAQDLASYRNVFRHKAGVVVNTCHGVKGEEFHTVIAFGLLQGYIPNWGEENATEAARRLLYVICSRAKRHLYLISEDGRITKKRKAYETTEVLDLVRYKYDKMS